ncbi:MAG: VWA domain-containing protein [Clostridiaceae bacterium]
MIRKFKPAFLIILCLSLLLTACGPTTTSTKSSEKTSSDPNIQRITAPSAKTTLKIVSGSENKELTPILEAFSKDNNISLEIQYKGSLDIMRELENTSPAFDAVWPASSLWISMGDVNHKVKHIKSTSITPVVFGIKKSIATSLGFVDNPDVTVNDILLAINSGKLKFSMTSATQSNSGASAYLGFLSALAGNPDVLTAEDLQKEDLKVKIRELLAGVDRSSGSSEWLKTLFLQGDFDAMVNYESLIITTNRELTAKGKEPLYVVYPKDGLAISDSPLGYISGSDQTKEDAFLKLQNYLTDKATQSKIQELGRRTGFEGVSEENQKYFNKDWGIDTKRVISPVKTPARETITLALDLYQTQFKKPSLNIYALDYSGSMAGDGNRQLVEAMKQLLIQSEAKKSLLQASELEENILIFFDDKILDVQKSSGNGAKIEELYKKVQAAKPTGGTDIYGAAIRGLNELKNFDLNKYSPAIILLTDGKHNGDHNINDFRNAYKDGGYTIPVFSIMFGQADGGELENLAEYTNGRVFDGRKDLTDAFRKVKGYN